MDVPFKEEFPANKKSHHDYHYVIEDFGNGYGISVVQGQYTYGGPEGLYEIGLLYKSRLETYAPWGDQVCGFLTTMEVHRWIDRIKHFPAKEE